MDHKMFKLEARRHKGTKARRAGDESLSSFRAFVPARLRAYVTLWICVLFFLLMAAGCAVTDRQVISQANDVNTQLKPAIMTDPQLATYIQQVGDRIIAQAKTLSAQGYGPESHDAQSNAWMFSPSMKFHLVNSKTLNAFTTGGEHMYIYSALFEACKTEDALAAVMAHEYAHVYCRHVQQGMRQQQYTLGAAALAGVAGYALGGKEHGPEYAAIGATAGLGLGQFVGMGFTRKDEAEADKVGFQFYVHAGWDPSKFADFFKTMIDMGYDKTPEILSDHPSLANRVKTIDGYVKALPPEAAQWRRSDVAAPAQFQQLQARAAEIAKQMPDDQSLQSAQKLLNAFPSCVASVETSQQKEANAALRYKAEKKK